MSETKEQRKKKREARKALVLFLRRLRSMCATFSTVQEWYGETKKLKMLLDSYTDVLPQELVEKVESAMKLTDLTSSGIKKACKVLKYDLNKLIKRLPRFAPFTSLLIKGLVGLAVVAGGTTIVWNVTKVKLTIVNNNCSNIPIARDLPPEFGQLIRLLGIKLPLWLVTNGRETFAVPPITVDVTSDASALSIGLMGQELRLSLPSRVTSITFNSRELMDQKTALNFKERKTHVLTVQCQ